MTRGRLEAEVSWLRNRAASCLGCGQLGEWRDCGSSLAAIGLYDLTPDQADAVITLFGLSTWLGQSGESLRGGRHQCPEDRAGPDVEFPAARGKEVAGASP